MEYQIARGTILAPISGIISNVNIERGSLAPVASPLFTIFQDQTYLVEVLVLEEDIHSLEKNMEVTLYQDRKEGNIVLTGAVQKIAPSIVERLSALGLEEQRVKVTIGFELPENLRLLPGSRLDVEFTTEKRENELVVPKTVLFPYQGGHGIWVVKDGKAQVHPVVKGFETERHVVIEQGLERGDLVILNPQLEGLREGIRISRK